jgi:hypothetical protein
MGDFVEKELHEINSKLDRLLEILEELRGAKRAKARVRKENRKRLPPLTDEEIKTFQNQFAALYERWRAGQEVEVQNELETFDVILLRRFADANNLNVTAKMPRPRLLHLIGTRFREKRQLLDNV